MSSCTRCQSRPSCLSCPQCQKEYCSKRCQHIDTRHGEHCHTQQRLSPAFQSAPLGNKEGLSIPTQSPLAPYYLTHPLKRRYRFGQSCSNYLSFGMKFENHSAVQLDQPPLSIHIQRHLDLVKQIPLIHPLEHSNPEFSLILVPHLENSIYLHLGEDVYESKQVMSVRPFQSKHTDVDLAKVAEQVGQALGQLQFGHGVDGYNFALTWSDKEGVRLHLDLLYTNSLQSNTPESIQCFGSVLGLSPYVPRADQGELFDTFCRGYGQAAGEEKTREIVEVMKTFLS